MCLATEGSRISFCLSQLLEAPEVLVLGLDFSLASSSCGFPSASPCVFLHLPNAPSIDWEAHTQFSVTLS